MKKILLSILTVLFYCSMSAQNNSVKIISKKTHLIVNGTVDTIYGDGAVLDVKEEYKAVMESQDSMLVGIRRVEITTMPNTKDYFCWYLCYQPVAVGTKPNWIAPDSLWMYKNDTISNFSVYLQPNGNMGVAQYRYIFYPGNNPTDSSYLDVLFNIVSVGINDFDKVDVNVYPNPVADQLIIELPYEMDDQRLYADLFDISGHRVLSKSIVKGRNSVFLPESISNGSYMVRILQGNVVHLNKIIEVKR